MADNNATQASGRISSPEQLNDYLRVTTPRIWLMLAAIVLFVVGLLVWSATTTIESYAIGSARVSGGEVTVTFEDPGRAAKVSAGMTVDVGGETAPILSVGTDEQGNVVASAQARIPDGLYDARVGYSTAQVISMLFN